MSDSTSQFRTLSIIIPAYNERFTLAEIVDRVVKVPLPLEREVIIVDDSSTDSTGRIADELAQKYEEVKVVHQPYNQGKGAALRTGFRAASGDLILIQDADLEYDPQDYGRLLAPILGGRADVVYGSRFAGGEEHRVLYFWHTIGNKVLTLLSNMATDLNLTDMETCYKVFRADIVRDLPLRSNRFGFEPEITAKVAKLKSRIVEVPISYQGRTYQEGKKINWKDGVKAVLTIGKYTIVDDLGERNSGIATFTTLQRASRYFKWQYEKFAPFVGSRVLELGAGVGSISAFLARKSERIWITETKNGYLDILRARFGPYSNVSVGSLDPTLDDWGAQAKAWELDTVICMNVLEHVENPDRVLAQMHEALVHGGRAIVLVPAEPRLYNRTDRALGHERRYKRSDLKDAMRKAGFEQVKVMPFNRAGAIGWWLNGSVLGIGQVSGAHLRLFDWIVPLACRLEWLPTPALSLVAVGTKR